MGQMRAEARIPFRMSMDAYPHCPAHVMILSRSIHVFKDGGALRVMMTRYMALESFAGRTVSEVDIPFWPLSNAYPHCPVHVLLAPGLLPSVSSLQLALAQKISHRRLHVLCEIAMEGDHVGGGTQPNIAAVRMVEGGRIWRGVCPAEQQTAANDSCIGSKEAVEASREEDILSRLRLARRDACITALSAARQDDDSLVREYLYRSGNPYFSRVAAPHANVAMWINSSGAVQNQRAQSRGAEACVQIGRAHV